MNSDQVIGEFEGGTWGNNFLKIFDGEFIKNNYYVGGAHE